MHHNCSITVSSIGQASVNPGAYLLSPNCFLPALGVPVANPRCPMALHRVEVCVLPNHLELLQHKHGKTTTSPIKNTAGPPMWRRQNQPPDAHLVDEVHGGREEHHDPARRLPSARTEDVLPREHDGDHGFPGAGV